MLKIMLSAHTFRMELLKILLLGTPESVSKLWSKASSDMTLCLIVVIGHYFFVVSTFSIGLEKQIDCPRPSPSNRVFNINKYLPRTCSHLIQPSPSKKQKLTHHSIPSSSHPLYKILNNITKQKNTHNRANRKT